jgi:hypothetical protein
MSFINHNVNKNKPYECSFINNNNSICSYYNESNNNILTMYSNNSNDYTYIFNDVNFANDINNKQNSINIKDCNDILDCTYKTTYSQSNISLEQIKYYNNDITKSNNICTENNICKYKSNNKFLLKKECDENNNTCYYNIYCDCSKNL